jgi:plastocyanin
MRVRKLFLILTLVSVLAAIGAAYAFAASTKTVKVGDNFFSKSSLTVKRGTKIKWAWSGTHNPHNITSKGHFHSKTQTSGSFTERFKKKGTYKILCTVHPTQMTMTVRVK